MILYYLLLLSLLRSLSSSLLSRCYESTPAVDERWMGGTGQRTRKRVTDVSLPPDQHHRGEPEGDNETKQYYYYYDVSRVTFKKKKTSSTNNHNHNNNNTRVPIIGIVVLCTTYGVPLLFFTFYFCVYLIIFFPPPYPTDCRLLCGWPTFAALDDGRGEWSSGGGEIKNAL